MKNRKGFLQLVLAVALLPTLSSVAQSESVVALSGNAYVTGYHRQRLDYNGGVEGENFFLTMGGFFDEYMKSGTFFERAGNRTEAPEIDFSTLE